MGKSIYKYYSIENCYWIENLENSQVAFSAVSRFNDPFELYHILSQFAPDEYDNPYMRQLVIGIQETQKNNNYQELNNKYRVACFSSSNDIVLMWAHYASMHKGYCVEYEIDAIESLTHIIKPIKYVCKPPE